MEEKICPLLILLATAVPTHEPQDDLKDIIICQQNKCAWWQIFFEGSEKEYGECAIKSVACLKDMV